MLGWSLRANGLKAATRKKDRANEKRKQTPRVNTLDQSVVCAVGISRGWKVFVLELQSHSLL